MLFCKYCQLPCGLDCRADEEETEKIFWKDVIKWAEDEGNIYLFVSSTDAMIISKEGFTECSSKELKELLIAIMGVREEEQENVKKIEQ